MQYRFGTVAIAHCPFPIAFFFLYQLPYQLYNTDCTTTDAAVASSKFGVHTAAAYFKFHYFRLLLPPPPPPLLLLLLAPQPAPPLFVPEHVATEEEEAIGKKGRKKNAEEYDITLLNV